MAEIFSTAQNGPICKEEYRFIVFKALGIYVTLGKTYSHLHNKRAGPNKQAGLYFLNKSINRQG
jgi:hypothetical protein